MSMHIAMLMLASSAQPPRAIPRVPATDSAWRGSFSLVERTSIAADTAEVLDGPHRRAAVGLQANVGRSTTLRSERVVRLEGTLVPHTMARSTTGAQRAQITASYASDMRSTELMPTRVRCTATGAEQLTTVVRTIETAEKGIVAVQDEVTATNMGIEVLGPALTVATRMRSQTFGDDVCRPRAVAAMTQETGREPYTEFEHALELERYGVSFAPNPREPNISTGSKVEVHGAVVRTWTWALTRGPVSEALHIQQVTLEHHRYPDSLAWHHIGAAGTVDGNAVRVRIAVRNDGAQTATDVVTLRDTSASRVLAAHDRQEARLPITVEAHSTATVEFLWDTQGWSWEADARPHASRQIEARLAHGAPGADAVVLPVVIVPRPVVLVHGLWSDASTWGAYPALLAEAHSLAWRAFAVGDGQVGDARWRMNTGALGAGTLFDETNSLVVNAQVLARYVTAVRATTNAWHLDLVGHSMGGLISRYYLTVAPPAVNGGPVVRHLVMLGTPNLGSPCAVPLDLLSSGSVEAYRQLTPEVADAFNRRVRDVPGVEYAILAGDPLPKFPCIDGPLDFTHNDGVVSVPSAFAWYHDRARTESLHTDMTGSRQDFLRFVLPRLAVSPGGR